MTVTTRPVSSSIPCGRDAFACRAAIMGLLLLVLAAGATPLDLPLARVFQPRKEHQKFYPALGRLTKAVNLCEAFSYGGTVLLVIALAGRLDAAGVRAVPRLLAGAYGSGLSANIVKLVVARDRPKAADLDSTVLATFHGWLPMLDPSLGSHDLQSIPSAHTATAFGLATVLAWKYPRGGLIFFVLAALAGLQRIQVMDHFASDVLCGAALGLLCGAACLHQRLLGRTFDRMEAVAAASPNPVD